MLGIVPARAERSGLWLHGTSEEAARKSIREGFLRPLEEGQRLVKYIGDDEIAPLPGRVYLTRSPISALAFGLHREWLVGRPYQIPYVLEVAGHSLVDVEPDEDAVGSFLLRATYPKLNELALVKLRPDLVGLKFSKEDYRNLWRSFGLSAAPLGKWLLSRLNPKERRVFLHLKKAANIAHVGPLPIVGAWRVKVPYMQAYHAMIALSRGRFSDFGRDYAKPLLAMAERVL